MSTRLEKQGRMRYSGSVVLWVGGEPEDGSPLPFSKGTYTHDLAALVAR